MFVCLSGRVTQKLAFCVGLLPSLVGESARVMLLVLFVCVCLCVRARNSKTIAPIDLIDFFTQETKCLWLGPLR